MTGSEEKKEKFEGNTHGGHGDYVDLGLLLQVVWSGKWLIVIVSSLFVAISVKYALVIPDQYQSKVILIPASTSSSSSLSRLAGQFGGLASLAGVDLSSGGTADKTIIAIELLKTWGFLEKFVRDNGLEAEVSAVTGWNQETNELLYNEKIYDKQAGKWLSASSSGTGSGPTSWELYDSISNRVAIVQDSKTGIVTLSVEHYSPHVAKRWAELLVESINGHIKEQDRKEALNSIEYLKEQIGKTSISEMKAIFYQLIEEQTKTLMLAQISDEYVLKTLSEAKVAEKKSKPKRKLIVIFGGALGGAISVMFVLIRFAFKRHKAANYGLEISKEDN